MSPLSHQLGDNRPMIKLRASSILQLTLTAFTVVSLPLIAALASALVNVDELSDLGRESVAESARIMRSSEALTEEITAMERHARQYQVMNDPRLWELYGENRARFLETVTDLQGLDADGANQALLARLVNAEKEQNDRLSQAEVASEDSQAALSAFGHLSDLARQILSLSALSIEKVIGDLREQAKKTQRLLVWQVVILVSLTMALAVAFTILITRPLRHVDRAIRRLGSGDFSQPVCIRGPSDIENLGKRIDWLRNRLMELEAQKTGMLRQISHDLKTPLTVIREAAELLREGLVGNLSAEQEEVAAILRENSLLLQNRIEDLLSFSVARTPNDADLVENVLLNALLEQVISEQGISIKSKGLRMDTQLQPVHLPANPEQLRVIFCNLVSNAVKFSPPGGRIRISLRQTEGEVTLDVEDQGPGISEKDRERIFEAFYQGSASPQGYVKGTGLGLAIAQELAGLHRGTISVLPAEKGAHLRLRLPMDEH